MRVEDGDNIEPICPHRLDRCEHTARLRQKFEVGLIRGIDEREIPLGSNDPAARNTGQQSAAFMRLGRPGMIDQSCVQGIRQK